MVRRLPGRVFVGTSGYSYKSWGKDFYPPGLPKSHQFNFYSSRFSTVEINLTFYRLPTEALICGWQDRAPAGFTFAMKGSRFITHMKKLTDLDGAVERYFDRLQPLKSRVGAILWQLPPMLHKDLARLGVFLGILPCGWRHAVEFRHSSWLAPDTFRLLEKHDAAHVSVSSLAMPMNLTVTTDFLYVRFHGLEGGFAHDYTRRELEPWARHIRCHAGRGKTVYAYFNNDANCRAPANAETLMHMAGAVQKTRAGGSTQEKSKNPA